MGYALESSDVVGFSQLQTLQVLQLEGKTISGEMLAEAIEHDLKSGEALANVYLEKYLAVASPLSKAQLMQIVLLLRTAMVSTLAQKPDIFLTYAHAAVMCVKEMEKKDS